MFRQLLIALAATLCLGGLAMGAEFGHAPDYSWIQGPLEWVDLEGGRDGEGPGHYDALTVLHWNRDGVCTERVVAFDRMPS